MTIPRAVGLVLILASVASGAVWMRVQRARTAHEIHQMARLEVDLVRQIDEVNAVIANLRAPQRIRERALEMQLSALPPEVRSAPDPQPREGLASKGGPPSKRKR
jgi:hypothetical protein